MATKIATVTVREDGVKIAQWASITEADTGQAVSLSSYPDRTVQVTGDFTSSGAITIEGSNDNSDFATLHDNQGNALVLTDTSIKLIAENPDYIRPRATAGSSVSMDVVIVASK